MSEYETILVDIVEDWAEITINRPDKLNAINLQVVTDLHAAVDELAKIFHCVDRNGDGEIDEAEFALLLDQLFPDRCDENEQHVKSEFAKADRDNSKASTSTSSRATTTS